MECEMCLELRLHIKLRPKLSAVTFLSPDLSQAKKFCIKHIILSLTLGKNYFYFIK